MLRVEKPRDGEVWLLRGGDVGVAQGRGGWVAFSFFTYNLLACPFWEFAGTVTREENRPTPKQGANRPGKKHPCQRKNAKRNFLF